MWAPPGGSEWIISVEDYADNSFTALGSSDPGNNLHINNLHSNNLHIIITDLRTNCCRNE